MKIPIFMDQTRYQFNIRPTTLDQHQDNIECNVAAANDVQVLGQEPKFRDQAAENGITLKIIQYLQTENSIVKREAMKALTQLIQSHDTNKGLFISNKGRPVHIQIDLTFV